MPNYMISLNSLFEAYKQLSQDRLKDQAIVEVIQIINREFELREAVLLGGLNDVKEVLDYLRVRSQEKISAAASTKKSAQKSSSAESSDQQSVYGKALVAQLVEEFSYIDPLYKLLSKVQNFLVHLPDDKKSAAECSINELLCSPLDIRTILVRLQDEVVLHFESTQAYSFLQQQISKDLHSLGQLIENNIQTVKRDKSTQGFPTNGDYAQIVHHARLAELMRRLPSGVYGGRNCALMMSLLSYLRFDEPGMINQQIARELLLSLFSYPRQTLKSMLSEARYDHKSLLSQQGYAVQLTAALAESSKAWAQQGASIWSKGSEYLASNGHKSDLMHCLSLYRDYEDLGVGFEKEDQVEAVYRAISMTLLPVVELYGLKDWNAEFIRGSIQMTASACDEDAACSSSGSLSPGSVE
jgi:hypothetical protein